jgi:hypothetical protein
MVKMRREEEEEEEEEEEAVDKTSYVMYGAGLNDFHQFIVRECGETGVGEDYRP